MEDVLNDAHTSSYFEECAIFLYVLFAHGPNACHSSCIS